MATRKAAPKKTTAPKPPANPAPPSASDGHPSETVDAIVRTAFVGPDAPDGAEAGDRLTLTPDRLAFLHARHLADKA